MLMGIEQACQMQCDGCGRVAGDDFESWRRTAVATRFSSCDGIASWCPVCQRDPLVLCYLGKERFPIRLVEVLGKRE